MQGGFIELKRPAPRRFERVLMMIQLFGVASLVILHFILVAGSLGRISIGGANNELE